MGLHTLTPEIIPVPKIFWMIVGTDCPVCKRTLKEVYDYHGDCASSIFKIAEYEIYWCDCDTCYPSVTVNNIITAGHLYTSFTNGEQESDEEYVCEDCFNGYHPTPPSIKGEVNG